MATKKQLLKLIKSMAKDHNKALLKECERLLNCGAIDTEAAENNFLTPRIIFHVALLNEANQYAPRTKETIKEVNNLKNF